MDQYYVSFPAAVIFSKHSVTIKKNFTGPHEEAWVFLRWANYDLQLRPVHLHWHKVQDKNIDLGNENSWVNEVF